MARPSQNEPEARAVAGKVCTSKELSPQLTRKICDLHAAGCENVTPGAQLAHLADEAPPARGVFLAGAKSSAPGTKLFDKSSVAAADALRDSMVHSIF